MIVGSQFALACRDVYLADMNWISPELVDMRRAQSADGLPVKIKLHNTAPAAAARLFCTAAEDRTDVRIELVEPEYGIAPGQAGVVYDGGNDRLVLGGAGSAMHRQKPLPYPCEAGFSRASFCQPERIFVLDL